jgi:group II intron reverse transcriptase/maturase
LETPPQTKKHRNAIKEKRNRRKSNAKQGEMNKSKQLEFKFQPQQDLFEDICAMGTLKEAFKAVKRNKGAPGVDGTTIGKYEEDLVNNLEQLRREVREWRFKPTPVKRVEIPKPGGKGVRLLGIPIVKDRVLHMAIKMVLEPILDPTFSESSFGFRPGKNQQQAVQQAQKIVCSGKEHVVDIDLSKFFDRINHDRLIFRLKRHIEDSRVLRLIGMILRGGIMIDGVKTPSEEGSVQGSPLSPLLSNVVLDELDKELEKRNLEFCRYADDCNIFARTQKGAERLMNSIKKFIETKLKLKVNEEKSKTRKSNEVKFLGMTIVDGAIAIAKAAIKKALEKVKDLIPRGSHLTIKKTMKEVNAWYRGWASYFKMTQYPFQLKVIEAHIRRRLRARIVAQQKRRKHLFSLLLSKGIDKGKAAKAVYTNRGTWNLSHGAAMEHAFPIEWFVKEAGQIIISSRGLGHWFGTNRRVRLT